MLDQRTDQRTSSDKFYKCGWQWVWTAELCVLHCVHIMLYTHKHRTIRCKLLKTKDNPMQCSVRVWMERADANEKVQFKIFCCSRENFQPKKSLLQLRPSVQHNIFLFWRRKKTLKQVSASDLSHTFLFSIKWSALGSDCPFQNFVWMAFQPCGNVIFERHNLQSKPGK